MFAAIPLKNSVSAGPASRMIASTTLVSPLAGRELRALLEGPEASAAPLTELREVERTLRQRSSLEGPGSEVLRVARGQLDAVGCRTPALGMLRLKLARQIARDDATAQAERTGEPVRWYPSPVVMQRRKTDRERAATAKNSTFANTEPSTQLNEQEHSS